MARDKPFNVKGNKSNLCLVEKIFILQHLDNPALLNKRKERIRYKNKYLLKPVDPTTAFILYCFAKILSIDQQSSNSNDIFIIRYCYLSTFVKYFHMEMLLSLYFQSFTASFTLLRSTVPYFAPPHYKEAVQF